MSVSLYKKFGFTPFPLHPYVAGVDPSDDAYRKPKLPRLKGWKTEDQSDQFRDGDNWGIRLNENVDVDFDWVEASDFHPLFPKTMGLSRAGRVTHLFYKPKTPIKKKEIKLTVINSLAEKCGKSGEHKNTVLEIRSTAGAYTMTSPSIHPCGEQINLLADNDAIRELVEIENAELYLTCGVAAFMAVVKCLWRDVASRHEGYLRTSGILRLHFGIDEVTAGRMLRFVAGPDEEQADRDRAVKETYAASLDGGVSGWDKFQERAFPSLSDAEIDCLRKFVPKKSGPPVDTKIFDRFIAVNFGSNLEILDTEHPDLFPSTPETFSKAWGNIPCTCPITGHKSSLGQAFLKFPQRKIYTGLVIEPPDYDGEAYNVHRDGFRVEPSEGDIQPFLDHVRDIYCGGDLAAYAQVIDFLAHMVQFPWLPSPPFAIIAHGPQRQGKSIVSVFMKAILGKRLWIQPTSVDWMLTGKNRGMFGKVGVFAEEITFAGSKKQADQMKSFISDGTWQYEEKFMAQFTGKNVARLIATTNQLHAAHLDDDDSRWLVLEVKQHWDFEDPEQRAAGEAHFAPIYKLLNGEGKDHSWEGPGPARLLHYLLNHKINFDNLRRPVMTASKKDQVLQSDIGLDFLSEIAETGIIPDDVLGKGIICTKSATEHLRKLGPVNIHTVTHAMKRVFKDKVKAMVSRNAIYVEKTTVNENGGLKTYSKYNQRGYQLPQLAEFRAIMTKITGID